MVKDGGAGGEGQGEGQGEGLHSTSYIDGVESFFTSHIDQRLIRTHTTLGELDKDFLTRSFF